MSDEERKAVVKKHESIISAIKKDIKKKKGAYKAAAEEKLAEAEAAYEEELAAFSGGAPADGAAGGKKKKKKEKKEEKEKVKVERFSKNDLQGMSNKELQELCTKYALGKKGNKESLITKLMTFSLEQGPAEDSADDDDDGDDEEEKKQAEKEATMTEEEKKEGERLYKREVAMQKALKKLLVLNPDGVDVPEVLEKLMSDVGIKNFKPQMLNQPDMESLLKDMPDFVLEYVEGTPDRILPAGSINI